MTVAFQLGADYFHLVYLLTLGFLSTHLAVSTVLQKKHLAILTAIWVMVCFRLLSTASVPYPIIQSTDVKFELQNVNSIISEGTVPWGRGSGFAYDYSYFPGLEIVVSVLSVVSLIPQVALLKYAGSLLGVITVTLFLRIYFNTAEKQSVYWLAAVLAALSPWFIAFDTYLVHQTPAFLLLGMLFLSLSEGTRREWIIVTLLGMAGIVVTHAFTSYICTFLLLLLTTLKWHSGKKMSAVLPNLRNVTTIVVVIMTLAWTFFASIGYLPNLFRFVNAVTESLFVPEFTLRTVSPTGTKPLWVVALSAAGLMTYFLIAFGIFARALLGKHAQNRREHWLAFGGFLIFGALHAPYLTGFSVGTDLQGRGLTYLYFFTAPLVGQFLLKLCRRTILPGNSGFQVWRGLMVTASLIFIILAPAVYYGVSPGIYDRNAPVIFPADLRLSLGEWQAAATFANERISADVVYGVRLAQDFIGGLAGKEVKTPQIPSGGCLASWLQQHRGLLFLRLSIIATPEYAHISETDLFAALNRANVLYSSSDVVVVTTP